jgi:hypothetical protein
MIRLALAFAAPTLALLGLLAPVGLLRLNLP